MTTTRRRIDLCTCGKPKEDAVHDVLANGVRGTFHVFMPHPQPPPLPGTRELHSIIARRNAGVWHATVSDGIGARAGGRSTMGYGQAAIWIDAVNAAIEDLKEKA